MSDQESCPRCKTLLPPGRPAAMCPACLLGQARIDDVPQPPIPSQANEPTAQDPRLQPTSAVDGAFQVPSLDEIATTFPQWDVLEEIGRGGMGAVYKVRQKSLNRLVALKVLPRDIATDPTFAERFTREAQTLAMLGHPNIVTIHESGCADGLYYLLMEFVDGVNLRNAIRASSIQPSETLEVVRQICEALQYAHDHGVVHRDIKPENILLDKSGRVKIADFGLAKLAGSAPNDVSLTRTHQVLGTWRYMAPEQLDQPPMVDHRADIYSLGVVFYELLTGRVPAGRFKRPSEQTAAVDQRLDDVVLRALEREPDERYQQASELSGAFSTFARNTPDASDTRAAPLPDVADVPMAELVAPARLVEPMAVPIAKPVAKPSGGVAYEAQTVGIGHGFLADPSKRPWVHLGRVCFGGVMLALGVTFIVNDLLHGAGALLWVGVGLSIGGASVVSSGFAETREPSTWLPCAGHILGGLMFCGMGLAMLIAEEFDTDLFTWIGMGLTLAGGGMLSHAWDVDIIRRPLNRPHLDRVVLAIGFAVVGIVLLWMKPFASPHTLTWIGMGVYLGGAGTIKSAWSDGEAPTK